MSKNVKINNVTYSDVPSIDIPLATGSGNASFYDVSETTRTASDVASGKYFFTSRGEYTRGTSSGGGGASNIVQGTFTTGSTRNTTSTVSLSYSGSGYPIAFLVYVDGGAYNNSASGNTDWYNSVNRYDVGWVGMVKSRTTTTPTYTTSGADNYGTIALIYKNSTTTSTTYTRTSSMSANTYTSSSTNPGNSTTCVRFKGNGKTLAYYVGNAGSSNIGLAPSTKYAYAVIYSS